MSYIDKPVCKLGELHNQQVSTAITDEEAELLHALVRMAKPDTVWETGAGHGVSTVAIGSALKKNGFGHLFTCETREFLVEEVKEKIKDLPVTLTLQRGVDLIELNIGIPSFVFLDSGHPQDRLEELTALLSRGLPLYGGYLVIHDVYNPNDGDYRTIFEFAKRQFWPYLAMESNAGIAAFRRMN